MQRYRFTCDYVSAAGSWATGDEAEFADDFAAWLNRDVNGCVEIITETVSEERAVDAPPQDRMVKSARRRDRQGDPSDQGPITKDDYKAVRGA